MAYPLPPVVKVQHEGRELRCVDAGDDWTTLTRILVDYGAFHRWAPLVERDVAALEQDVRQLEIQLDATRGQRDIAQQSWDLYREMHQDERQLRLRANESRDLTRLLLGGGLAVAVLVIAVESVVLAVK